MSSELELRKKILDQSFDSRKEHRNRQRDTFRCDLTAVAEHLADNVTPSDILKLCNRIKRRKHLDDNDIYRLAKGFLCSPENIIAFLNTQGALNVLLKELTGSSGDKQISITEALCNLSLGDSISCLKIAKQVATYILPLTSSQNPYLAQTSLWILYNLMAHEDVAIQELFHAQGVASKMVDVLGSNVDEFLKLEATKCLSLAVASPVCSVGTVRLAFTTGLTHWTPETPRLVFEILQRQPSLQLSASEIQQLHQKLIDYLPSVEVAQQLYIIRILGNTLASSSGVDLDTILLRSSLLVTALNAMLNSDLACHQEALWFLGNLLTASGTGQMETTVAVMKIIDSVTIPRTIAYEFQKYNKSSSSVAL